MSYDEKERTKNEECVPIFLFIKEVDEFFPCLFLLLSMI